MLPHNNPPEQVQNTYLMGAGSVGSSPQKVKILKIEAPFHREHQKKNRQTSAAKEKPLLKPENCVARAAVKTAAKPTTKKTGDRQPIRLWLPLCASTTRFSLGFGWGFGYFFRGERMSEKIKIEFGDFQTPLTLATQCAQLIKQIYTPGHIVEPTCGLGFFLEASSNTWPEAELYGYEINKSYITNFNQRCPAIFKKSRVLHTDFFDLDFDKQINVGEKPLVIGNPPWVTNSQLGVLGGKNLPKKSNVKGLSGFEALSGKSNFDISEWMIMKLTEKLKESKGVLAMLCKTIVARNIFLHNQKNGFQNVGYKIFKIDSKKEFNVSVDACLFVADFYNGGDETKCELYDKLNFESYYSSIGVQDGKIIANVDLHEQTKSLAGGNSSVIWRSGLKHDASKVMELKRVDKSYINGFGDTVDVEEEYLFPLLKSSDLANSRLTPQRYVIVTQRKVGQETSSLQTEAPKLWAYLKSHSSKLDGRKSSIYKKQPRFSMFGVGDYSFKKYKVGISGLYKKINFCLLTPFEEKPIMVDDTCYTLGFDSLDEAKRQIVILRSNLVQNYISSLTFWDAKRPINSSILKSIDLDKAAEAHRGYDKVISSSRLN